MTAGESAYPPTLSRFTNPTSRFNIDYVHWPFRQRSSVVERTVILGAARTPFGRFGGALSPLSAPELGGAAIREAIDRSGVEDAEIQHSIFGVVVQAGIGQIPPRQANFHAGLHLELTTETPHQVCASGLRSATP